MECEGYEKCDFVSDFKDIGSIADSLVDAHFHNDDFDAGSPEWRYATDAIAAAIYKAMAHVRLELMRNA